MVSHPNLPTQLKLILELLHKGKVDYISVDRKTNTPLILQIAMNIAVSCDDDIRETLWLLFDELTTYHADVNIGVTDPVSGATILHMMAYHLNAFDEKKMRILVKVIDRMFEKGAINLIGKFDYCDAPSTRDFNPNTPISLIDRRILKIWLDHSEGNQLPERQIALRSQVKALFVIMNYLQYKEKTYENVLNSDAKLKDEKMNEEVFKRICAEADKPSAMLKYQMYSAINKNDEKFITNSLTADFKILQQPLYLTLREKEYLHKAVSSSTSVAIKRMLYQHVLPELLNEHIESFAFIEEKSQHAQFAPASECIAASIIIRFKAKDFLTVYKETVYNFLRNIKLRDGLGFIDRDPQIFTGEFSNFNGEDELAPELASRYITKEIFGYNGISYAGHTENSGCIITINSAYLDNLLSIFSAFRQKLRELAPNITDKPDAKCAIIPTHKLLKVMSLEEKFSFTPEQIKFLLTIRDHNGDPFSYKVLERSLFHGADDKYYGGMLETLLRSPDVNSNHLPDSLPVIIYFIFLINRNRVNYNFMSKKRINQVFNLLLAENIDLNATVSWDYRLSHESKLLEEFNWPYDIGDDVDDSIQRLYDRAKKISIPLRYRLIYQGLKTIISPSLGAKRMNYGGEACSQIANEAAALIASMPTPEKFQNGFDGDTETTRYNSSQDNMLVNSNDYLLTKADIRLTPYLISCYGDIVDYLNTNRFHRVPAVQVLLKWWSKIFLSVVNLNWEKEKY